MFKKSIFATGAMLCSIAVKIAVTLICATVLWFIWNELAPIYFNGYINAKFLSIPFWHMCGFFVFTSLVLNILKQ